jgi:hypothetical protein
VWFPARLSPGWVLSCVSRRYAGRDRRTLRSRSARVSPQMGMVLSPPFRYSSPPASALHPKPTCWTWTHIVRARCRRTPTARPPARPPARSWLRQHPGPDPCPSGPREQPPAPVRARGSGRPWRRGRPGPEPVGIAGPTCSRRLGPDGLRGRSRPRLWPGNGGCLDGNRAATGVAAQPAGPTYARSAGDSSQRLVAPYAGADGLAGTRGRCWPDAAGAGRHSMNGVLHRRRKEAAERPLRRGSALAAGLLLSGGLGAARALRCPLRRSTTRPAMRLPA